jgi:hypothetical protein
VRRCSRLSRDMRRNSPHRLIILFDLSIPIMLKRSRISLLARTTILLSGASIAFSQNAKTVAQGTFPSVGSRGQSSVTRKW